MKFNNKKIIYWLVLASIIINITISLPGCNSNKRSSSLYEKEKIIVYTSFYSMYDLANKVGGDKIDLRVLIPPGSEPHEWEPGPQDIGSLKNADVFIYNGAGMEPWVEDILNSVNNKNIIIVETSKGIELLEVDDHNHSGKDDDKYYDPHVWLNPLYAKKQMEAIKNALIKADAENRNYYEENFNTFSKKMDELDFIYRKTISGFSRKDLIVTHGAFGYLCNSYGLRQIAIEGYGHDSEPSPGKMAEIVNFIRENDVKTIFYEENSNAKVAETIAREAGVNTMPLNTLGSLSEKDINNGKEYFSIMMENLETLEAALK